MEIPKRPLLGAFQGGNRFPKDLRGEIADPPDPLDPSGEDITKDISNTYPHARSALLSQRLSSPCLVRAKGQEREDLKGHAPLKPHQGERIMGIR